MKMIVIKKLPTTWKSIEDLTKEAQRVRDSKPRKTIIKDVNGYWKCITLPSELELEAIMEEDRKLTAMWYYDYDYGLSLNQFA